MTRPAHEEAYKRMFAHPRVVADLLRGFALDQTRGLDFSSLERVPAEFVGEYLQQRFGDMLWQIRFRDDRRLYLLVLLEFQSENAPDMALRILEYSALALGAAKRHRRARGRRGRLPAIRYLLLDISGAHDAGFPMNNLVSELVRVERTRSPDQLSHALAVLSRRLEGPEHRDIRRAFVDWVKHVVVPRKFPDVRLVETESLGEVRTMLAETVKAWTEQWYQDGVEKGRESERRALVRRLVLRKFGPGTAERVSSLPLSGSDQIAEVISAIFECDTREALIARVSETAR